MKRYGVIALIAVLVLGLAIYFAACSGGGGSSSVSTGTASAGVGASVASTAINSGTMALSSTVGGSSSGAPHLKPQNLSSAVNSFYSGLQAKRASASAFRAKLLAGTISSAPVSTTTNSCLGGGTVTTIWDVTTAGTTTITTLTLTNNNCTDLFSIGTDTISQVWNGSTAFSISESPQAFSFTFSQGNSASTTPLTLTWTRQSDSKVVLNDSAIQTFTGTADLTSAITCTPVGSTTSLTQYQKFTISMDANMHYTGIDLADKPYDVADNAKGFTLVATSTLDNTCTATGGTITESGAVAHTDNIDPKGNTSLTITSPLTLIWASVVGAVPGNTYDLSGSSTTSTPCFTGSITLATTTPIFIPTGATCPTAGVITVSGTVNGSVNYTASGGVDIKNSQGTTVESYTSCDEAKGCV